MDSRHQASRTNKDIIAEAFEATLKLCQKNGEPWFKNHEPHMLALALTQSAQYALSAAGRHIVSEGEAVIGGKRGRLERTESASASGLLDVNSNIVYDFVPSVDSGTDRP